MSMLLSSHSVISFMKSVGVTLTGSSETLPKLKYVLDKSLLLVGGVPQGEESVDDTTISPSVLY